mmetsp:Transcript_28549/g.77358  ORF Transcript_28549/g.77358 Transcript_28549/m.77358 type:complete len:252 (-) Transcript_28549:319-1074(-)
MPLTSRMRSPAFTSLPGLSWFQMPAAPPLTDLTRTTAGSLQSSCMPSLGSPSLRSRTSKTPPWTTLPPRGGGGTTAPVPTPGGGGTGFGASPRTLLHTVCSHPASVADGTYRATFVNGPLTLTSWWARKRLRLCSARDHEVPSSCCIPKKKCSFILVGPSGGVQGRARPEMPTKPATGLLAWSATSSATAQPCERPPSSSRARPFSPSIWASWSMREWSCDRVSARLISSTSSSWFPSPPKSYQLSIDRAP